MIILLIVAVMILCLYLIKSSVIRRRISIGCIIFWGWLTLGAFLDSQYLQSVLYLVLALFFFGFYYKSKYGSGDKK